MASPSLIDDLGDEGCALRELRVMILATEEVAIGGGGVGGGWVAVVARRGGAGIDDVGAGVGWRSKDIGGAVAAVKWPTIPDVAADFRRQ